MSKGTYDSTKAAFEMAGNTLKEGYSKSRTPWQILRDIVETYDADGDGPVAGIRAGQQG